MLPYSIHIAWSEEDQTFIARCPEFPDLAADGATYEAAVTELRTVLQTAVEICEEDGKDLPAPRTEPSYSGNLSLRLGASMHRRVAELAEYEGTSINSLLQTAIAFYLGMAAGRDVDGLPSPPELPTFGSGGLRPGVDIDSGQARRDAMEG